MYVVENKKEVGSKIYTSTLLVESYREGKEVKHRTISNLSSWTKELVEEFKLLLKGGKVTRLEDLNCKQGKSCGALIVIYEICKRLGILKALGKSRKGQLAVLMIMGRILTQKSRLYIVESWSKDEAIEEILKIKQFSEDDLYETLDWISDKQEKVESELFRHRKRGNIEEVFLYDVTSSYLEGEKNELADFGHNRDGKKGKKQIVIGLMTDSEGYPVSIEVFKGNTQDPMTVINQLKKLKDRFGVKRVIFVGDRGMIKKAQIEDINELAWNFITAITKPQIEKLINEGIIQMEMFEDKLVEVEEKGIRYIIRRNPQRAREIEKNRACRLDYIIKQVRRKNIYLLEHKKASVKIALKNMNKEVEKRKLSALIKIKINRNQLEYTIDNKALDKFSRFDGCYVIKTDVLNLDKEIIHERYKDLTFVEQAFRTIKTALEEIRPIFVRKESRTRGHVFICMLAYMVIKYAWLNLKDLGLTQDFIFKTLDKIQYHSYLPARVRMHAGELNDRIIKVIPNELLEHQNLIINRLQIKLPQRL